MRNGPINSASDLLRSEAVKVHTEADRCQEVAQEKQQEAEAAWKDVERIRALAIKFEEAAEHLDNSTQD
jgi:hypothetical protein